MKKKSLIKIVLLLLLTLSQVSFARLSEKDSLKMLDNLDTFFEKLKKGKFKAKEGMIEKVLTEDAQEWFEELVDAVESADSSEIVEKPFFEIISILGLRYYYRERILEDLEPYKVLSFYMKRGYMNQVMKITQFSEYWTEKQEFGYRGLKKAPRVPILFFRLEQERWRLELPQTLEIISRAAVSLGRKKGWSDVDLAITILDGYISKDIIDKRLLNP